MKVLVIVMSLTISSHAVAGKRLSEFLTIAWPQLSVATVTTAGTFAFLDPSLALLMSASVTGGVGLSLVEPLLDLCDSWIEERERDTVGKKILYRDGDGTFKAGKVEAYYSVTYDGGGLQIAGEETPMFLADVVATSIPDHHEIGREVELLTEADDTEALHYAGVVVAVFDNGSYELELQAKVDALFAPPLTEDVAAYHRHYIDIEPRRLIVAKNVALKDGGFRFARQENSPREEELLLDTASRQDNSLNADERSTSYPDVEK